MANRRPLTPAELAAANRLWMIWTQRKAATGMTQERLAFECGWRQQSAVSQYLKGAIPLNLEALLKFASVLEFSPAEVFPELAQSLLPAAEAPPPEADKYEFASRVHGVVLSAGGGNVAWEHEEVDGSHAFTRAWLQRKRLNIRHCRILTVEGDSMLPELRNGFVVLIDLSDTAPVRNGKVYAISVDGEQRIKRLFRQVDGSLLLQSDNPDKAHFPDEIVRPEHLDRVAILGRKRWHAGDDD